MRSPGDDVSLTGHFSVLVYPFLHDLGAGHRRTDRLRGVECRWAPWWSRLGDPRASLAASDFFLPHVRALLFPETTFLEEDPPGKDRARWIERLRRRCDRGSASLSQRLPLDGVLRLSARPELHRPLERFAVVYPARAGKPEVHLAARLEWVDAVLFSARVGFLMLKVHLAAQQSLAWLISLNNALRYVHSAASHFSLPRLRFEGAGRDVEVADLLDHLLHGLVESSVKKVSPPGGPVEPRGEEAYPDSAIGRALGERCQLLSYACARVSPGGDPGVFASAEDRLLFEYATCINVGSSIDHPKWAPTREQADQLITQNRFHAWRCWRAMSIKETCVFLGTEDIGFNRDELPHIIEHTYLPLYLYALHQHYQLLRYASALTFEVAQSSCSVLGARQLLRRFVAFRNRYWFSAVTRKPQGGQLYRLMQRGLEVPELFEMVSTSVKGANDYYEGRFERVMRLVRGVPGVAGSAAGGLGMMGMWLGWSAWHITGAIGLVVVVILVLYLCGRLAPTKTHRLTAARRRPRRHRPAVVDQPVILPIPRRAA